jgi:hypothetical protein
MSPASGDRRMPLISEDVYQAILRRTLGEEMAALCNLPYQERLNAIAEYQGQFQYKS